MTNVTEVDSVGTSVGSRRSRRGGAKADDVLLEEPASSSKKEKGKGKNKTGHEDEKELYKQRCRLYRFDAEKYMWKERGVGDVKLMRHSETGKVRVVMRRDQVHKVCANHTITPRMQLKPLETSDRTWVYSAIDLSEGDASPELLAIKFKNPDIAQSFKEKFEECRVESAQVPTKQEPKVEGKPKSVQIIGMSPAAKELAAKYPQLRQMLIGDDGSKVRAVGSSGTGGTAISQQQGSIASGIPVRPQASMSKPSTAIASQLATCSLKQAKQEHAAAPAAAAAGSTQSQQQQQFIYGGKPTTAVFGGQQQPTTMTPSAISSFTFRQPVSQASAAGGFSLAGQAIVGKPSTAPTTTTPSAIPSFTFRQPVSQASAAGGFSLAGQAIVGKPSTAPTTTTPSAISSFTFRQPVSQASASGGFSLAGQAIFGKPSTAPTTTTPSAISSSTFRQPVSQASAAGGFSLAGQAIFGKPSTAPTTTTPSAIPSFTFRQPVSQASAAGGFSLAGQAIFGKPSTAPTTTTPSAISSSTFRQPVSQASAAGGFSLSGQAIFGKPSTAPTTTTPSATSSFTFRQPVSQASAAGGFSLAGQAIFGKPSTAPTTTTPSAIPPFTFRCQPVSQASASGGFSFAGQQAVFGKPSTAPTITTPSAISSFTFRQPVSQGSSTPAAAFGQAKPATSAAASPFAEFSISGSPAQAASTTTSASVQKPAAPIVFGQPGQKPAFRQQPVKQTVPASSVSFAKLAPLKVAEDEVILVSEKMPSTALQEKAKSLLLPPTFYNYLDAKPCPGCISCRGENLDLDTLFAGGSHETDKPTPAAASASVFGIVIAQADSSDGRGFGVVKAQADLSDRSVFGATASAIDFAALASKNKEWGFPTKASTTTSAGVQKPATPATVFGQPGQKPVFGQQPVKPTVPASSVSFAKLAPFKVAEGIVTAQADSSDGRGFGVVKAQEDLGDKSVFGATASAIDFAALASKNKEWGFPTKDSCGPFAFPNAGAQLFGGYS